MIDHNSSDGLPRPVTARPLHPHVAASRGLAGLLGLDYRAALLTILVDVLVFGADTFSLETLVPLGMAAAGALGFIVYKIQRKFGDDHDSALIKSMIIALLTAIPVPITPLIAIPGGLLGILRAVKRK